MYVKNFRTTNTDYENALESCLYQGIDLTFKGAKSASMLGTLVDNLCDRIDSRFPDSNPVIEATKIAGLNNWPAKDDSLCIYC